MLAYLWRGMNEKILKFELIRNDLRTKFKCLKLILSPEVENLLGVLWLFKISRDLNP